MVDSEEEEKKSPNNEVKNEAIMSSTEAITSKSAPIKWMDSLPSNYTISLPVRTIGGIRDQTLKRKQCTCKKSSCLKLYCDCFNSGIFCNGTTCKCLDCKNQEFKGQFDKDIRTEAIMAVLDRNENAFRAKAQNIKSCETSLLAQGLVSAHATTTTTSSSTTTAAAPEVESINTKLSLNRYQYTTKKSKDGCNCKKSACLKKYCECFQATLYCTSNCRCSNCENIVGNDKREKLVSKIKKLDTKKDTGAVPSLTGYVESNEWPEDASVGGIPAKTVALVSRGLVTAGVDVFLPPGNYARPLLLPNGRLVAEVGFGMVGDPVVCTTDMDAIPKNSDSKVFFPENDTRKRKYSYMSRISQKEWVIAAKTAQMYKDQMMKAIQKVNKQALTSVSSTNSTLLECNAPDLMSANQCALDVHNVDDERRIKQKYSELAEKSVATIIHELNNITTRMNHGTLPTGKSVDTPPNQMKIDVSSEEQSETIQGDQKLTTLSDEFDNDSDDMFEIVSRNTFIYTELTRIIQEKVKLLVHNKNQI